MKSFLISFYPEAEFGGFSDVDGTVTFYQRVNALLSADAVVVDFGCGTGDYGQDRARTRTQLRHLKGNVKKVIGLDVDPRAAGNPFLDEFRQLEDDERWPVESDSIHLVLCDNVIEHLVQPDWFFREARRVLFSGGHLCIRTPNVLSYPGLIARLVPNRWHAAVLKVAQPGRPECFPTLYRCNTLWRLRRFLARHGFEAVVYGYEAEPRYLDFSKLAYRVGVWHQRWAPGFLRSALFAWAKLNK